MVDLSGSYFGNKTFVLKLLFLALVIMLLDNHVAFNDGYAVHVCLSHFCYMCFHGGSFCGFYFHRCLDYSYLFLPNLSHVAASLNAIDLWLVIGFKFFLIKQLCSNILRKIVVVVNLLFLSLTDKFQFKFLSLSIFSALNTIP